MAHLWIQDGGEWRIVPLECGVWLFDGATLSPGADGDPAERGDAAVIASFKLRGQTRHLVCAPAVAGHVSVNGSVPAAGAHVLRDRDELLLGESTRAYYSTERRPTIVAFPGPEDRKVVCPRCKEPIQPDTQQVVECPGPDCGLLYHQTHDRPCWSYSDTCVCGHPTSFEAEFRWTPAAL